MTEIMRRRRAILQQNNSKIPQGYIQDGLIFFLDGKQKLTSSSWEDIVSGKKFNLYNCTVGQNGGAVFDGLTSYGECQGPVSSDFSSETIEIVCSGIINNTALLVQPIDTGISMVNTLNSGKFLLIMQPNVNRFQPFAPIGSKIISTYFHSPYNFIAVADKVRISGNGATLFNPVSEANITTLGAGNNANRTAKFNGTIYAIRIYNRFLTQDEIMRNQTMDVTRYNITLTDS